MEKIQKHVSKQEQLITVISVINVVCEYVEKEKKSGQDKIHFAVRVFHIFAKELHKQDKISNTLYGECEMLTEDQVEDYINDVIHIWNRTVSLIKRTKRILRKVKCSKKEN